MDILQITRDIAVIVASGSAVYSLGTWRREFRGKRDIELAESVLELFYKAERAIEAIRFPIYDLRIGQEREPGKNETAEQKEARDHAWVVFKKIKDHADIFDQLYAMRFRFMARFGKEKAKPFDELKRIVDEIWVSAQQLAELWTIQRQRKLSKATQAEMRERERVIWYSGSEDSITRRLKDNVRNVEAICRPIIDVRSAFFATGIWVTLCSLPPCRWVRRKANSKSS